MENVLLKSLIDRKYIPVIYPVEGIVPLEVIVVDDTGLDLIGPLAEFFESGTSILPAISSNLDASEIHDVSINKTDSKFGMNFLSGILSKLGLIVGANIMAHYKRAKKLSIDIQNIKLDKVTPSELSNWLSFL